MNSFEQTIAGYLRDGLRAREIETLQVNTGFLCDQECAQCYLGCGPDRTEVMTWPVMQEVLRAAEAIRPRIVEITGGAPELNPFIREFVAAFRDRGLKIRLRTNLTAMAEPGLADMPGFLRGHEVKLVASASCFAEESACVRSGEGIYERSILALKRLNDVGYSINPELQLNLMYNPGGSALPGGQSTNQAAYRRELYRHHNISFSRLWSITNMSLLHYHGMPGLRGTGEQHARLMKKAFNPRTLELLACRHQVCIGWDGSIHDCDINMALREIDATEPPRTLADIDLAELSGRRIRTGNHCFGCTMSFGSSGLGLR